MRIGDDAVMAGCAADDARRERGAFRADTGQADGPARAARGRRRGCRERRARDARSVSTGGR
jgi:hypothetical protein